VSVGLKTLIFSSGQKKVESKLVHMINGFCKINKENVRPGQGRALNKAF
jgi:hypothetical protein